MKFLYPLKPKKIKLDMVHLETKKDFSLSTFTYFFT